MKLIQRIIVSILLITLCIGNVVVIDSNTLNTKASGIVTGQQLVDEAKKYLGKVPYVYGGNTIDGSNPGADCSGFICRIYERFGINMWANRTALRNCGTNLGTDLSVAQLGDIIWFSGHVAIYAGVENGKHMIVHETGGVYQNVVYTKVSVVNAELKGIIRIPGVTNDGNVDPLEYYYATPARTDGTLSLNDQPKNSDYCTRLAEIPEGAVCKVYFAGASGNWKQVEYNGIRGYAYGTYLDEVYITGTVNEETHPHNTYILYSNGYRENVGNANAYIDVSVAASCIKDGYQANKCELCDYEQVYNILPKKGHTVVKDNAKAATCKATGLTEGSHCSVCKKVIVAQKTIAKTEHTPGAWTLKSPATVSHAIKQKSTCIYCGVECNRTIGKKLTPTIKLSAKKITLKKGKSKVIKVSKLAKGDKVKEWKSNNKKVAKVSSEGKIVARNKGSAKITVILKSGKKGTVSVKVK